MQPNQDPGSSTYDAYVIENLAESLILTEFLGSTDERDIYKFSLTEVSNLDLVVSGLSESGIDINLFVDSNQDGQIQDNEEIDNDFASDYKRGEISATLGIADYFIRLSPTWESTNTNYTLDLSANPVLLSTDFDPSSISSNAYDLGIITESQSWTEFLGSTDERDIYKFSLTEVSNLNLLVSGLNDTGINIDFFIDSNQDSQIQDNEKLYSDSAYKDSQGEINAVLGAADYFVRLWSTEEATNTLYTLNLSSTPTLLSTDRDPGNTGYDAYDLGTLIEFQGVSEFLGTTDEQDVYQFSLSEISNLDLEVLGLSESGIDIELFIDSNKDGFIQDNEEIDSDYASIYDDGSINTTLGVADYFVRLSPTWEYTNTNYTLNLLPTPVLLSTDFDPGDTGYDTYDLGYMNLNTSEDRHHVNEFVGSADKRDIYQFSLLQTSEIDLSVSNLTDGEIDIDLFLDSNKDGQIQDSERLDGSYAWEGYNGTINITLDAGTYFIRLDADDYTNTSYNLNLKSFANSINSVITIEAIDSEASENENDSGVVRISRQGDTSKAQTITYNINTSYQAARNGIDYTELSGSVTIPENEYYVDLVIAPIDDEYDEITERVNITLTSVDNEGIIGIDRTATVTIEDNDNPDRHPFISNPITNFTVNENTADQTIDLSNVFQDADGDEITLAVNNNSNYELVRTFLLGNNLTLNFVEDTFGSSDITIEATANGKTVSDTFTVTVNEVVIANSFPIVANPITDLVVKENAANQTIDLSNVFQDADGDEITLAVKNNSNSQLVSTVLDRTNLILDFADDLYGTSNITIEATANGEKVSDTFIVNVNEVVDEPQLSLKNVHRFYQYQQGYHLYTSDINEINHIKAKSETGELAYNYEAEQYQVLADNRDAITGEELEGVQPIYRFFNTTTGAHLYTMDENEKNVIQDSLPHFNYEGITYYAFASEPENLETIPVYRMFNNNSGAHLYSSDRNEIDNIQDTLPHFSMENSGNAVFHVFEL